MREMRHRQLDWKRLEKKRKEKKDWTSQVSKTTTSKHGMDVILFQLKAVNRHQAKM